LSRLLIAVLIATALALPAQALREPSPAAAAAGPSCTGHGSTIDPPATIRVGRADGSVDTVNFRTYVGRVMAKEWNITQPAALETAAVAVKQYAWYYALAGNWRKSYVNASGKCFDVKDSTADQIYRNGVTVAARIWSAVDVTWGLSVRKSGRFFLTGYRAGTLVPCGSDATGFRLFAKSVIDCAKKGLTREEIQRIYYAPDLTFVWSADGSGEAAAVEVPIGAPAVELLAGVALGGANARISWHEDGTRPAGTTFQLQRIVSGAWRNVSLADPTRSSVSLYLKPGVKHGFRVRLRDADGNTGDWYSSGSFTPKLVQNTSSVLRWTAGWKRQSTSSASGGSAGNSVKVGSAVTHAFSGSSYALVGTTGPTFGLARIYVDGVLEAEVDLYSAKTRWRRLIFSRSWDSAGAHSVRVEVASIKGRTRVHFDAGLVLP
jgi:hypothetical protein